MKTEKRGIPLMWSTDGPSNERNAFGEVVTKCKEGESLSGVLPLNCMHGGSEWLCESCAEKTIKDDPKFRKPTPEELEKMKLDPHCALRPNYEN